MARLIPSDIDDKVNSSYAERMVFDWFTSKEIPGTAYYSLLQKNHIYKLMGEVDFLYVCDRGVLCIEVKGGQEIKRTGQKWSSKKRTGEWVHIKDPFWQAVQCMNAAQDYLTDKFGEESECANSIFGYAVIFPECIFTGTGNDLVTEVLFDARYKTSDFPDFLRKTFDYWENLEIKRHDFHPQKMSISALSKANELLRGDFSTIPSMSLQFEHIERQMVTLTEEQYNTLESFSDNPRMVVLGSAGTGKSLLALEQIRRSAAVNKKVLFICFNNNIARFTQKNINESEYEFVPCITTFHSLMQNTLNVEIYNNSIEEICSKFISEQHNVQQYDVLIVDEGQDLMKLPVITVLNHFLKGGITDGSWIIFADNNQNIYSNSKEYDDGLNYLKAAARPCIQRLTVNCRNTKEIGRAVATITHSKYSNCSVSGPDVEKNSYKNYSELSKLLTHKITSLLSGGGLYPSDIVIISRYKKSNSDISFLSSINGIRIVECDNILDFDRNNINYFTVHSFKGLESKVILFIDIDGFSDEKSRRLNYVALSRPKYLLSMYYKSSCQNDFAEYYCTGYDFL